MAFSTVLQIVVFSLNGSTAVPIWHSKLEAYLHKYVFRRQFRSIVISYTSEV